jgi:hypothetical protein
MPRYAPALCCLVFVVAGSARAAGPYDDLLKYTPPTANTVVLIDVKGALASPLAKAEKWREKGQPENRGGLGFVPSDAEAVVIAVDVNLNAMTRDCQVGLVKVWNLPNMRDLAAREGGSPDEIAGQVAALSPRDVYFTSLPGNTLVAVYPADRQYTARYLKAAAAKKTGELSPYLRAATAAAAANTVTIAVDLEDVVDKNVLKLSLPASPSVAKVKAVDVNLLATFLSQIKGLTFSAKVTDTITASIAVEFAIEPARFRKTLPDLLREVLEGQGVAIEGFESWKAEFTDTTMTLSGTIATADLKRIVSLFAFPSPAGEPEPAAKGNAPTAATTGRYLQAVDVILTDIGRTKESPNYEKTATWYDKAADQLQQLSTRNVDPAAVTAAHQAAKRLRAIGQSLRGVPIDTKALSNQEYFYGSGGSSIGVVPTWWGLRPHVIGNPAYVETNIPKIRAEIAKVVADDKKRRAEAWDQITRIMIDVKNGLSVKYNTPF